MFKSCNLPKGQNFIMTTGLMIFTEILDCLSVFICYKVKDKTLFTQTLFSFAHIKPSFSM